ncbi:glycosyltransferase family 4 protein [Sulfurimonas sp. HSL1-6]|uniref:glycosyltransferase family 4 protein n=1 Tax=Thiomicrolovo immobilis TaxID=3131935 RepID=UPI0031F9A327
MKYIAIIEPVGGHGGMDWYDFNMLDSIRMQNGCSALLYTCDATAEHEAVKHIYKNIYGKTNKLIRGWNYVKGTFSALLNAKAEKVKIIHLHFIDFGFLEYYNLLLAKRVFGFCVVGTVHDVESFEKYAKGDSSKHEYEKFLTLLDAVVLHTEYAKRELVNNLKPSIVESKKIETIYGPDFDFESLDSNFIEKKIAREHLNLPQDRKVILFFGQIKKVKGLDLLLKALAEVITKEPSALLVIAGKVWKDDYSEYENIIEKYGLANYVDQRIGYVDNDDVPHYFNAADLVVLPYRKIYNSGVLIRSMSFGTPVLASDFGPFKEFIIPGKNGFLFEAENVESLAENLHEIMADMTSLKQVSLEERASIKEHFALDSIGKQYCDLYESVLNM